MVEGGISASSTDGFWKTRRRFCCFVPITNINLFSRLVHCVNHTNHHIHEAERSIIGFRNFELSLKTIMLSYLTFENVYVHLAPKW